MNEIEQENLQRIRTLSELLDTKFQGPLGIRFGMDALLGLLPIFGDLVTTTLSFYIIFLAARAGCPVPVVLRMVLNVLVENLIDFIPVVGNIFDFIWKSNQKNLQLFMAYETSPGRVTTQSNLLLSALVVAFLGTITLLVYSGFLILSNLYHLTLRAL